MTYRIVIDSLFATRLVNKHWAFRKQRRIVVQVAGGASLSDEQVTCFVTGGVPINTAMFEPLAVLRDALALCVTFLRGFA